MPFPAFQFNRFRKNDWSLTQTFASEVYTTRIDHQRTVGPWAIGTVDDVDVSFPGCDRQGWLQERVLSPRAAQVVNQGILLIGSDS